MPELPEVETIRRGLHELIIGRIIKSVDFDYPRGFPNSDTDVRRFIVGATVTEIRRRAKVLLIDLSTDYTLVIHLKMTGQLVFRAEDVAFSGGHPNDSLVGKLPDRSTHVTFTFVDGSHLYFNDQRKFGWVLLLPTLEVPNTKFMLKVGPEPLDPSFTAEQFYERFTRRARSPIKAALLDQTVVAGVGNIYADESLWGAKIHPKTLVKDVSKAQFKELYKELKYVLNLSIKKGGSTNRNYVNADGRKGSYMDFARVFRREGQPCPRCSTEIIKLRVAGRGTHICPHCQVLQ